MSWGSVTRNSPWPGRWIRSWNCLRRRSRLASRKPCDRSSRASKRKGVHSMTSPELQDQGASVGAVGHQKSQEHKRGQCLYCDGDARSGFASPAKASRCNNCGSKKHFAKECLKKELHVSAVQRDTWLAFVGAIDADGKARYVQVLINSVTILAQADSSTEVSVLPSSFPGFHNHLDKTDDVLQGDCRQQA